MSIRRFFVNLSLLGSRATGVGLYSFQLAKRLEQTFDCQILAQRELCPQFANPIEVPAPISVLNKTVCRNLLARGWRQLHLDRETFVYTPHMRGLHSHDNQIVTIHDLIHHHYPTRYFVENAYNAWMLPGRVRAMRGIFTVSETVRQELAGFYQLDPERIHVVPNGIDLDRWSPAHPASTGEPYLLMVSANRVYKNTIELLDLHSLWAKDYRLKLVSTQSRYGRLVRAKVRELGLTSQVDFLDDLSEADLIELYRGCSALVYPSLMEGFGRPALEAMAVGRPVIVSDIAVLKESFGDAAIFITPGCPETWDAAFAELRNPTEVRDRIARGLRLAADYSLKRAGDRLVTTLLQIEPELAGLRRNTP